MVDPSGGDSISDWLSGRPEITRLVLVAPDVNGFMRGKSLPAASAAALDAGQVRMCMSTPCVDVWGDEIPGCSGIARTGDCDATMRPTGRAPHAAPLMPGTAIVPVDFWMEGAPLPTSPRHALAQVIERLAARGLSATVAVELEFYLFDPEASGLCHPRDPRTGKRLHGTQAGRIDELAIFSDFFTDLEATALDAGLPVTAITSENGTGMFEVNLSHRDDALAAADDAVYLRRLTRDVARRHGLGATFMAKPFPDLDGAGLHVHVSLRDADGTNVFDDGGAGGTDLLRHAVGGLLRHVDGLQLVMAPHYNSYRRIQPGAYAPTKVCWGYDNRSVPLRIPAGAGPARRIEHRIAGADANPYTVVAAVLGAMLDGIATECAPPAPVTGMSYDRDIPDVLSDMGAAIDAFASAGIGRDLFHPEYVEAFVNCKRQELATFRDRMTGFEISTYRDTV